MYAILMIRTLPMYSLHIVLSVCRTSARKVKQVIRLASHQFENFERVHPVCIAPQLKTASKLHLKVVRCGHFDGKSVGSLTYRTS